MPVRGPTPPAYEPSHSTFNFQLSTFNFVSAEFMGQPWLRRRRCRRRGPREAVPKPSGLTRVGEGGPLRQQSSLMAGIVSFIGWIV